MAKSSKCNVVPSIPLLNPITRSLLTGTLGPHSNYPCPSCGIHKTQLADLTKQHPRRTSEESQTTFHEALAASSKTAGAAILSAHGLAPVMVCSFNSNIASTSYMVL